MKTTTSQKVTSKEEMWDIAILKYEDFVEKKLGYRGKYVTPTTMDLERMYYETGDGFIEVATQAFVGSL